MGRRVRDASTGVAPHGGVCMPSHAANDDAQDHHIFEAILQSFDFTN